jgi:hypothetical protein
VLSETQILEVKELVKDLENCNRAALIEANRLKDELENTKTNLKYIKEKYDNSIISLNNVNESVSLLDKSILDLSIQNCELKSIIKHNDDEINKNTKYIEQTDNKILI